MALHLLRFRHRGWNGGRGPVADARWALAEVQRLHPGLPVALLGHSMGARTAVHVADDAHVRGLVALAPWFPPGEPVEALAAQVADAELVDMGPVGHYLLRRVSRWNDLALTHALALLV